MILSMLLLVLPACSRRSDPPPDDVSTPDPIVELPVAPQPVDEASQVEEEYDEFISVHDAQDLYELAEYLEAAAADANITAYALPEAEINVSELLALLEAVENGGNAVFEVYFFSYYDFIYHKLEVTGGSCVSTGWEKRYGSDSMLQEWSNHDVGHMELLSTGALYLQYGRKNEIEYMEMAMPVYRSDLPAAGVQAHHTYLSALEFNGLEQLWSAPSYDGIRWDDYFEMAYRQEYGISNIWSDYPDGHFPAEVYEGTIQQHFDVSTEKLRVRRNYNAETSTYFFEGGRGGAYLITTRVLDISHQGNNTLIRYSFDQLSDKEPGRLIFEYETIGGVQRIKRGKEEYLLTVENTEDGFLYISNQAL